MNIIFKRFLAFFLSLTIIFSTTTMAYANSPAGWAMQSSAMAGAQATITAIKGSGSNALKSVVTHTPSAVAVGKQLAKGVGGVALAYAMVELIGAGVDWVLDPANNTVKYKDPAAVAPVGIVWCPSSVYSSACVSDAMALIRSACLKHGSGYSFQGDIASQTPTAIQARCSPGGGASAYAVTPPSNAESDYKTIPLSTVGAKVLGNAAAGHAPSQDLVRAAAVADFDAGAIDAELDALAKPTTDTPKDDAQAPPFDPSGIIDAIKSLYDLIANFFSSIMDKITEFFDSVADFFQWFRAEPETVTEDTTLDIPTPDIVPADTDINFGGSCPANFEVNSSIFGNSINIVLLDTTKFCGFLSTFVKYPVYAVSSLFALYILGGRKDV